MYIKQAIILYISELLYFTEPHELIKNKVFQVLIIALCLCTLLCIKRSLDNILWGVKMIIGSLVIASIGISMRFGFMFLPAIISFIIGSVHSVFVLLNGLIILTKFIYKAVIRN